MIKKFNIVNDTFIEAYPFKVVKIQEDETHKKIKDKESPVARKKPQRVSFGYQTPIIEMKEKHFDFETSLNNESARSNRETIVCNKKEGQHFLKVKKYEGAIDVYKQKGYSERKASKDIKIDALKSKHGSRATSKGSKISVSIKKSLGTSNYNMTLNETYTK